MRMMLTVLIMATLTLSACGRKGDLKPPPGPASVEEPARTRGLF